MKGALAGYLTDLCRPDLATVRNGYLLAEDIANPEKLSQALEARFDAIRVGVHDELDEAEPLLSRDLDVVVNGRNLGEHIDAETLAGAARERGGVLLAWPRRGRVRIHR
jgi:hypothetical protein